MQNSSNEYLQHKTFAHYCTTVNISIYINSSVHTPILMDDVLQVKTFSF